MTTALHQLTTPQTRRWTREEFYRLAEEGWFEGQRVMLLEGEIIQMPPMKHPHAVAASKVAAIMRRTFGDAHWVREDKPFNAGENSDPEPDIAVLERPMSTYQDHPSTALLIVEVSDSSVSVDRAKAAVYAQANVPEYWLLNIRDNQLEVFRKPDPGTRTYGESHVIASDSNVSPLARPNVKIDILEMLPNEGGS